MKSLHIKAPNIGKIKTMTKIESDKIRSKQYADLQLSSVRKLAVKRFLHS